MNLQLVLDIKPSGLSGELITHSQNLTLLNRFYSHQQCFGSRFVLTLIVSWCSKAAFKTLANPGFLVMGRKLKSFLTFNGAESSESCFGANLEAIFGRGYYEVEAEGIKWVSGRSWNAKRFVEWIKI